MVADTNIILRYLLDDTPQLSREAEKIFATAHKITVTDVVVMELLYVLEKQNKIERQSICRAILLLLQRQNVVYDGVDASCYLDLFGRTTLDAADCYLIAYAQRAGQPLATFDKKMSRVYEQEFAEEKRGDL